MSPARRRAGRTWDPSPPPLAGGRGRAGVGPRVQTRRQCRQDAAVPLRHQPPSRFQKSGVVSARPYRVNASGRRHRHLCRRCDRTGCRGIIAARQRFFALRRVGRDDLRDDADRVRPRLDRGRAGTSAPFSRASFKPMAIACLRLRTRAPDPLLRVPALRRRSAEATVFDDADFLFAICCLRGSAVDV